MCGRFTNQMTWSHLYGLYNVHSDARRGKNSEPRFNICPTDTVEFVRLGQGEKIYDEGRWGLVPGFFKDLKKGPPLILSPLDYDAWLDPETPQAELFAILDRHINGEMRFHRVDRQVNSNRWKGGSEVIAPVEP